jgi:hypothetical protein
MKTLDDYRNFISQLRKETGIEALAPDENGLISVRIDDAFNVNLQFVEHNHSVLCFVEVFQLPENAPKNVYRELLTGNLFGKETAGGYFSVEEASETVVYSYFFNGDEIEKDSDEFVDSLENILQLCGLWRERIQNLMLQDSEANSNSDTFERYIGAVQP